MNICIYYAAEPYGLPAGGVREYTTPYLPDGQPNEWRCQFEQSRDGICGLVLRRIFEDGTNKVERLWLTQKDMDLHTYLGDWLPHSVEAVHINGALYWTAAGGTRR